MIKKKETPSMTSKAPIKSQKRIQTAEGWKRSLLKKIKAPPAKSKK